MTLARRLLLFAAILLALLGALAFFLTRPDTAKVPIEQVTGPQPNITPPRTQNFPNIRVAKVVGWRQGEAPTPAAGLTVNAFAAGLDHPRWLYRLPNGDILVAETNSPPRPIEGIADRVMGWLMKRAGAGVPSANRITLLRDADGDGRAELKTPFLTGLESPFGMVLVGNRLFIGNHNAVVSVPYATGQTRITAKPARLVSLPGGGNHWTKNLVASADGRFLYIAIGSTSNIGERGMEREDKRAAIWEVPIMGKSMRVYASGLRNPVGMAWRDGELWTVVNERDMLGPDVPPDYLAKVEFGAFYGWPYSYWGANTDRRVEDRRPDLLQYTKRPEYALGPHTASLGLAFGSLGSFQNGAFVGQHGSWNRVPPSGYKVAFVPFAANGLPQGRMRDVLTGFLDEDGRARGRPVGVLAREQDLLVADDVGNVIWRVSPRR